MSTAISGHTLQPEHVLSLLTSHLPYSLPLLRRLQFMHIPGGSTPTSNILASFPVSSPASHGDLFTIAYLDLSRGPETEMWLYSSAEHPDSYHTTTTSEEQLVAMLQHVYVLIQTWERKLDLESAGEKRQTPGIVLIGTLHQKPYHILHNKKCIVDQSPENFKFIFKRENFPTQKLLPEGFEWGTVRLDDLPFVLSRTAIPRKIRTMKLFPSVAVRVVATGEMVAWGFLGADGSLTTLHVEPVHRGKGLAKALSLKLFTERMEMYGPEELGHADVVTDNFSSQGVCKSLGGKAMWSDYWVWVDLKKLNGLLSMEFNGE